MNKGRVCFFCGEAAGAASLRGEEGKEFFSGVERLIRLFRQWRSESLLVRPVFL